MDELNTYIVQVTGLTKEETGAFGRECKFNGAYCLVKRPNCEMTSVAGCNELTARFVNECRLHSSLRHPNIVQFIGVAYEEEGGGPCLVLERMHSTLASSLESYANIPLPIKLCVLRDVSAGLMYLHSFATPIIHGALSTTNILLTPDWTAKIADFGNSVNRSNLTDYMPPEAINLPHACTCDYEFSLDIFSFGIVALYVATQTRDTDPDKRQEQLETLRATPEVECLNQIVTRCCEHDPSQRPTSCHLNIYVEQLCRANPLPCQDMVHLYLEVSRSLGSSFCMACSTILCCHSWPLSFIHTEWAEFYLE